MVSFNIMNMRNVLSLFDGISCGQVTINNLGISYNKYYASEIDKYAIQTTMKNFPNTIQLGDVSLIDTNHLEDIELIIGGSPCQSFTFAGKREGMITDDKLEVTTLEQYLSLKSEGFIFKGESYLFWEYVRIFKELKPKYFFLENVRMDKKWESIISKTMGVEPIKLNSNIFSATNRQRLYWTNIPINEIPEKSELLLRDIVEENIGKEFQLTSKHHKGFLRSYKWKHCELDEKSKPLLASYYKQPPHCPYIRCDLSDSGFRRLTPIECERLMGLSDNYTQGLSNTQRYKSIGNGWQVNTIEFIFNLLK